MSTVRLSFWRGAFLPLAWRKSSVLEGALPSTAPRRFNPLKLVELKLLKRRVPLETVETKVVLLQKWVFCKKAWVENPGYFTVFWCFVYGVHHFGMNAGIKYLLFSIAQKILFDSTTATKNCGFGRSWSMTPEAYQSIGRCGRSSGYFHLIGNILICCIDQTCNNCPHNKIRNCYVQLWWVSLVFWWPWSWSLVFQGAPYGGPGGRSNLQSSHLKWMLRSTQNKGIYNS